MAGDSINVFQSSLTSSSFASNVLLYVSPSATGKGKRVHLSITEILKVCISMIFLQYDVVISEMCAEIVLRSEDTFSFLT